MNDVDVDLVIIASDIGIDRLDEARFPGGQQLGESLLVVTSRAAQLERGNEIETDHARALGRQAKLSAAARQHVPGRPARVAQRFMGNVGTAIAVEAHLAARTGTPVAPAAFAIGRPTPEMPLGAGRQTFFSASSRSAGPR